MLSLKIGGINVNTLYVASKKPALTQVHSVKPPCFQNAPHTSAVQMPTSLQIWSLKYLSHIKTGLMIPVRLCNRFLKQYHSPPTSNSWAKKTKQFINLRIFNMSVHAYPMIGWNLTNDLKAKSACLICGTCGPSAY